MNDLDDNFPLDEEFREYLEKDNLDKAEVFDFLDTETSLSHKVILKLAEHLYQAYKILTCPSMDQVHLISPKNLILQALKEVKGEVK